MHICRAFMLSSTCLLAAALSIAKSTMENSRRASFRSGLIGFRGVRCGWPSKDAWHGYGIVFENCNWGEFQKLEFLGIDLFLDIEGFNLI